MMNPLNLPIIILIPVYEDNTVFSRLLKEIKVQLKTNFFVIAIDDGSLVHPIDIALLQENQLAGEVIKLKRNVGHQRAIALGLCYIADHYPNSSAVIMDADGEDEPKTIHALLSQLSQKNKEVAVAVRKKRVAGLQFRIFYRLYKLTFYLLTGKKINFGNYMVLKPLAIKRLSAMQELWIHIAGCVLLSKLPISSVPIERGPRLAGKSKMNFVALILHGLKALIVFSDDVLVRVGIVCAVLASLSLIIMPIPLLLKSIGIASPGWSSILFGVCLLVFIQTATLALITLLLSGMAKQAGLNSIDYKNIIREIQATQKL
jgi:glycosyltransferase involved in cell wall biosynthesis